ncbi:hypothetical protein HPB52_001750 [Rhipicephalus sanguineus]|uniref:Tick transposon n=1 Tax=Rhipicephalus sanguineus TaxID=34632 RepID=A0A9D4T8F5_RHISA|nr:hypothetical protein HPB52_001750 [Rhipicephalus sanguineus]
MTHAALFDRLFSNQQTALATRRVFLLRNEYVPSRVARKSSARKVPTGRLTACRSSAAALHCRSGKHESYAGRSHRAPCGIFRLIEVIRWHRLISDVMSKSRASHCGDEQRAPNMRLTSILRGCTYLLRIPIACPAALPRIKIPGASRVELDGYTDHNGRLLLEMTQELSLEIANLRADCEGTYTWCARGLSSCIDYALVSPGLGKSLRNVHIDEEGRHSLGSDHNRLRLQFEASPWRQKVKKHEPATRFLPDAAYEEVANEFELCPGREQADTYEQYIAQLRQIMRKHEKIVKARRGFSRKSWWDGEVQAAIKARRTANRCHRQCVKRPHSADVQASWQEYLRRKREMQAITQRKIAEANHKTLHAIKSAGRGAAAKFWTYVSRLDGKATQPEIRTESSGDKTTDLHRALTDHLHQLCLRTDWHRPPEVDSGKERH